MYHYKVLHPDSRNNITQMKSREFQPPFIAGGNQVAYNLGIKGNNTTSTNQLPPHSLEWSTTQRILASRR